MKQSWKRELLVAAAILVMVFVVGATQAGEEAAAALDAEAVFAELKALEGTWNGSAAAEDAPEEDFKAADLTFEYKVSANGTVVMETMMPGTDHEMINMYHLDGENLVLTHYCAGGNQPTMRLDRSHSTAKDLHFEFTGGTNLDPAKDTHIHSAQITFGDEGKIKSSWVGYSEGKAAGTMNFLLARK
jgi:hypothetical protein